MTKHDIEGKLVDLESNGFIRLGALLIVVIFVATASFAIGKSLSEITGKLDSLAQAQQRTNERITQVNDSVTARSLDRWSRSAMVNWCRETQALNPGWRCGAVDAVNPDVILVKP